MKEAPIVVRRTADNGEHSHWELIDQDGEVLWTEDPDHHLNRKFGEPRPNNTICVCMDVNRSYKVGAVRHCHGCDGVVTEY